MPDAGKSSLLGALAQAAQTQEHLLNGHLTDSAKGLAELQRRLYDAQPRETLEEVVPYPVLFEPFVPYERGVDARTEAVLVDCDGRAANDLLARRRELLASAEEGGLAQAVLEADALLLVIDAAATPSQVEADFAEFGRFLRLLEQSRGRRSDISGLPVFLVLTKCDLLAQPSDTPAGWIERIEARKRELRARFQEFLARQRNEAPLPFGSIDLHLWATAVKRPALVGSAAKPREPYGVAELFRQAFDHARGFQARRAHARHRLFWTIAASVGMVAGMLAVAVFLFVKRPQEEQGPWDLLNKIESYRASEAQTPSSRLREPLQPKINVLSDLQGAPDFDKLPEEKQEYVTTRLRELQEYQEYKERLLRLTPIGRVQTERELDDLETSLNRLAVPDTHAPDWDRTDAVLWRARRLDEIKAVRAAITDVEDWYRRIIRRGEGLWAFSGQTAAAPVSWPDWQSQVQDLWTEAENPPYQPFAAVPGSGLTYEAVFRFDRINSVRSEWTRLKQRLERVAHLSAALGLAGPMPGRSALDLPANFTADQAAVRLQELEKAYPRYREELTLAELPEAIAGEVRAAARTRYQHALEAGQKVVLRHLQDAAPEDPDKSANWRRLTSWLTDPPELKAWRVLATVLARLQSPEASDPVTALDGFLRQERFDLVVRRVIIEFPEELKVKPDGKLALHHQTGGQSQPTLSFEVLGDARHDARRRLDTYTFQPTAGVTMTYRPGDTFWIDLPVKRADASDWILTWAASRSQVFQFERLSLPPRLHGKGQPNWVGESLPAIRVEVVPEGGIPPVPDLLPTVPIKQ
jgi:hypothetical protein